MATHNADDGTGGLDASLFFERDRDEVGAVSNKFKSIILIA